MASGFAGGIAGAEDVCGTLVGAVMVIGALYGRENPEGNETACRRITLEYYQRFKDAFGSTNCKSIKDTEPGRLATGKCDSTVERGMKLLLEILQREKVRF